MTIRYEGGPTPSYSMGMVRTGRKGGREGGRGRGRKGGREGGRGRGREGGREGKEDPESS